MAVAMPEPASVAAAPAAAVPAAPSEPGWLTAGWRRVLSAPDAPAARAALEAIEAGGLARGIRSLPLPAMALLRAKEGTVRLPLEERIRWARRLGYDSAAVHFAAAKAAWSIGFFEALSGYGAALSALGRDFGYFAGVVSRLVVLCVLALILTCLVFTGAMAVKRGPGLIHDLDHLLPIGLPGPFRLALGAALAGLPFLFGLGWIGAALVWLLALWGTLANRERAVAALFLLLVAASQPIAGAVAALLPSPDSQRSIAAVLRVQSGVALPADRVSLAADARETGDAIAYFSLGRAAWLAGDGAEAISAMRGALAERPRWVSAMNNLAIFLLQQGQNAEAEDLLKRALAEQPRNARVLFNLSYLYRRDFRLKEAEKAYIEARHSDAGAVDRFTQVTGAEGSFVIPATLAYGDLWRKRLKAQPGSALLAENMARGFLGRIPLRWTGATVALGFILALLVSYLMEKKGRAGRCGHCGSDICPICHGNELQNGLCRPCNVIYVQAQPVEARVKLAQDQRVMRYRAERRRNLLIAGTAVPGLGHLLMEQTWLGTALLFLASLAAFAPLCLIVSGTSPGLWTPPLAAPLGGLMQLLAACGVLAAFVLGGRNLFVKLRPI
ncbi:MAG: tetratricopeptide repeat protein [Myxococcota bacterium]